MSLKYTIVCTVFFCIYCFQSSAGCSPDPQYKNVTICGSIEEFTNAGYHPEWTDIAIRNRDNKPKQKLKKDVFKNVPNLKTLVIDGVVNGFEEFPFRGMDKLESLILEYNEIKELPETYIFEGLNIKHLEIKHSGLKAIPANYFRNLKNLRQLDLGKNSITSLGDCAFCDLNNTVIVLSYNILKSFNAHKVLGTTSLIEGIELDNNNLTEISRFGQMFNLRGAKFSDNYITEIDDEAFLNSPRLMLLDLSYNIISEIPVTALPETIRSDERFVLEINTNHFDCLKKEFRDKFTALRKMTISSNPWDCKCLEDMKSWADGLNATFACELREKCKVHCTDYYTEDHNDRYIKMY